VSTLSNRCWSLLVARVRDSDMCRNLAHDLAAVDDDLGSQFLSMLFQSNDAPVIERFCDRVREAEARL